MGLFQAKKQDEDVNDQSRFFDETFREELRNHGRWYFEKIISENGEAFKKELDATIEQVNIELKDHVTKQLDATINFVNTDIKDHVTKHLDDQFIEYSKLMKGAQDVALQSLTQNAHALQEQYQELRATLQKSIDDQQATLTGVLDENNARLDAMRTAQDSALEALTKSTQELQELHQQLRERLQKSIADQETTMVSAFESNMARVIEHYLLEALGDQYDLKAQLPAIIQQMETNKQAIVDDMKL